jgi:hypothetical protein
MVVFDLTCINGHSFEGWFDSLDDLQAQIDSKLLVCPICNESNVVRRPSTFGLVRNRSEAPAVVEETEVDPSALQVSQAIERLKSISHTLETEFIDVGTGFTDEALKIHYGVSPRRNIRGMSTENQEEMLKKEGVEFFKVPMLVRKRPVS